jgi:hypothetical protein
MDDNDPNFLSTQIDTVSTVAITGQDCVAEPRILEVGPAAQRFNHISVSDGSVVHMGHHITNNITYQCMYAAEFGLLLPEKSLLRRLSRFQFHRCYR